MKLTGAQAADWNPREPFEYVAMLAIQDAQNEEKALSQHLALPFSEPRPRFLSSNESRNDVWAEMPTGKKKTTTTMQMGAEATTKKALNVAVCGHPAGSVYMKKWHWHTHPPATYRDIIIMLSQYELSYHVSSSGSPALALVYADASDAEGRQSQTKQILPCKLFKLTALASNNAAQNRRCQFDASQSFARNGCPSVLPPPLFRLAKRVTTN